MATGHVNIAPRGLGIAVLTGGIMAHVSAPLAAADATFTDMLGQQMVHAVQTAPIHTALNMAIGQEKFGHAVTASLRQGVGHAIGASLAHQMGQWYSGPDKINYFMHKMGHFASGALGGAITADDPLGGAFGAAFAEVSMEAMADAKAEAALVKQENPDLPKEELKQILHERLIAKRFFSQVIAGFAGTLAGGDFSVAANAAAIALDYNMMPTLLDEACREYYGLTEAALDAKEAARPATPRTFAAIKAFNEYNELYEHLDAVQREQHRTQGISAESYAANAYQGTERMLAENAMAKFATGQEITDYERGVISDFADLGIDKTKSGAASIAIMTAANVALKSVATRVPLATRLIAGKTLPVKVSQAVNTAKIAAKLKSAAVIPDRPSSSSFYTTLFKAELKPGAHYPGRDIVHFQEANKQLYSAMQLDTGFACQMETLYPGIAKAVAPGARGAFPINPPTKLGLTWHHNAYESGILELIPQTHHTAKGVVQANLHPGGKGGQQIWGGGRK